MTSRPDTYRRLPGRSFGVTRWDTVWIGADHLLTVQASPDGDTYRRFFFRDIEAVIMRRTPARMWINIVFVLFTLGGLLLWSILSVQGVIGLVGLIALAPLGFVLVNSAFGPTCEVRIQTAVQSERIVALSRENTARTTIAHLRPLIWQVQQREAATTADSTPPTSP